ncbi:methylmalonyl Co-A mutase-associated GTPase MeaB [Terrisporobacter mayombei]|uniref:GTPase n=1 Tax=Terrisporobacter mayombei TaxID=1541 RepID=A0ABY9Q522_9FIRM|nr:methylmalonyl Co-A mutase-associated GTPase MeaB [Terrisporobacter mayombei]MCC3868779.1 methylmalonyl Co-A mutase-associated GTPase MeaB [Terrisporobacter mayombei]WMT83093.1 putative GTPase [Terrisporobacter mayombei]
MENLVEELLKGNKRACARLITMIENEVVGYEDFLKQIYKYTGKAYVIGVTGPPGAGKSTFTDKVVKLLREKDKKVGVIAIDPTSPFTKGAILGDRIRMNDLNTDKGVFIRSMGTRGSLGGLSNATQAAIKVLDAYGCDYIFIETVGVGQSEVDIVKTADTTIMVMVPGLGDDIQAIKAGVMEIADVFVVNKADKDGAKKTSIEIEMMLDFKHDWDFRPPVSLVISENGEGVETAFENITKHRKYLYESKEIYNRRLNRNKLEVKEIVHRRIEKKVNEIESTKDVDTLLSKTITKEVDPYTIGEKIFESIIK